MRLISPTPGASRRSAPPATVTPSTSSTMNAPAGGRNSNVE